MKLDHDSEVVIEILDELTDQYAIVEDKLESSMAKEDAVMKRTVLGSITKDVEGHA